MTDGTNPEAQGWVRMQADLNDIEDKRQFLAHLEEEPKACRFGRWSLAWEGEGQVAAVVGNGTHTVTIGTLSLSRAPWPRVFAAALEELEPDHWQDQ